MILAALLGVLILAAVLGAVVWALGIAVLAALVASSPVTPRAWLTGEVTLAVAGIGYAGLAMLVGALVTGRPPT